METAIDQTSIKPYFCIWFNPEEGKWEEEFFDEYLDAFDSACGCDISRFRFHWGDTQLHFLRKEDTP